MSRKILVTGGNGQLGSELRDLSDSIKEWEFYFTDVDELDITDKSAIEQFVKANSIDTVINCAAYTAVDKAETEQSLAKKINCDAVANLVDVANSVDADFIHVSTDFIFDGTQSIPYKEDDKPNPINVYGQTKLEGEFEAKKANRGVILRTSWVYSIYGNNFVKSMIKYGNERDELRVIFDQVGTPTYAKDLADAIILVLKNGINNGVEVYNYSNEGVASWYDFAVAIMDIAKIDCKVTPIEAIEYNSTTKRPSFSVMNKSKFSKTFNVSIPYWRDSLKICIDKLK